ncbi:hypothetical protein Tco_0781243 [Tanacetum coccineum]
MDNLKLPKVLLDVFWKGRSDITPRIGLKGSTMHYGHLEPPKRHQPDVPPLDWFTLRDGAYENTRIYKERTKKWHDSRLRGDKDFKIRDKVLLFNSRLRLHLGKLKSKWYGPLIVKTVYPYGAVEITDKNGSSFKVNNQRLKKYYDESTNTQDNEFVELDG